jgi:hypothetical protein
LSWRDFLQGFYHEEILNFVQAFFASVEVVVLCLSFILVCCITFTDLHMLNHLCIPKMKPTWWWHMCWRIQFASILLRIFAFVLIMKLVYNFLVLSYSYPVLISNPSTTKKKKKVYCSFSMGFYSFYSFSSYWCLIFFHYDLVRYLLRLALWPKMWSILEKVP